MSNATEEVLFEALAAIDKHTGRLNTLDKKSKESTDKLVVATKDLERQIEASTKDVLLQLIEKGNTDKEALVRDITSAIATGLSQVTIPVSDISVTVETDSIADAISKLPVSNVNNITVDTKEIVSGNKNLLAALKDIGDSLVSNMTMMKLMFQEMCKEEPEPVVIKPEPAITGMRVNRNKDNLIESVEFIRGKK